MTSRADDTPDDRGGTEDLSAWADESILLSSAAHVWNVSEHPSLNTELNGSGNDGGNDLGPEHGTRGDLHVVPKLEVGSEGQSLRHSNVTPCKISELTF